MEETHAVSPYFMCRERVVAPLKHSIKSAQTGFGNSSRTKRLVIGAILASMAAVFQSAGGFLPGVGYIISPLATAPILFYTMLSLPLGGLVFLLTNLLLLILQPSELMIFPFTTGLMGLGLGAAFQCFESRWTVSAVGALFLTLGISILLFFIKFPVLGPAVPESFSLLTTGGILLFSYVYSWIWMELSLLIFNRLIKFVLN
jgi:hypothetical protein